MVKLIWTDQAIENLDEIARFIEEHSVAYAKLTVKKLYDRAEILKNFPWSGRIVREKNDKNLRELIDGNYRIIYEIVSLDRINILTVHHSARELNL